MRAALLVVVVAVVVVTGTARADPCLDELDKLGVAHRKVKRAGIATAVQIEGPLGGVTYAGGDGQELVIDCSLAVSLAEAGRYLTGLGFDRAAYSSAHSRRTVRGSNKLSKHSYGLAIDVHTLSGAEPGAVRVDRDYEQGLGDAVDCIGAPLTQAGALLRIAKCQLAYSGLFHLVLGPDYDDAHHNHFHLEARAWKERGEARGTTPAIH